MSTTEVVTASDSREVQGMLRWLDVALRPSNEHSVEMIANRSLFGEPTLAHYSLWEHGFLRGAKAARRVAIEDAYDAIYARHKPTAKEVGRRARARKRRRA